MKIGALNHYSYNRILRSSNQTKTISTTKPYAFDSVNFSSSSSRYNQKSIKLSPESILKIAENLSTATSGYRAPYGSETFDKETVKLIALGVSKFLLEQSPQNSRPKVLIGGDTRKATRESLPIIKDTFTKQGIDVYYIKKPVPTPLLAMAAKKYKIELSALMTASHNPWSDGGFNFITSDGAIAPNDVTKAIAEKIKSYSENPTYSEHKIPAGNVFEFDPYNLYINEIEKLGLIDFEKIKNYGIKVYYDGLEGTGKYTMPRLFKDYGIKYNEVISHGQIGPNPTEKNLERLINEVKQAPEELKIGLANDGDADRFAVIDEQGNFINPNDVLLLIAYHLIHNKGLKGDIVRSQATSQQLDILAQQYNLKTHVTPVGFKYLASDIMKVREQNGDILIAGEESGGVTVYGHIPEKDGIIADLLILDLVAHEKRPLSEILKSVKQSLGIYTFTDNNSIKYENDAIKEEILKKVNERYRGALFGKTEFGNMHTVDIDKTAKSLSDMKKYKETGDGYRFIMTDGSTVLIRRSGTEPLLRYYIETVDENEENAKQKAISLRNYIEEILKP